MKKILNYLFEHKSLSREQAKEVLYHISKNVYSDAEIAAFITVYLMRSISIDELQGFRDALMELCVPVDLDGYELMDIVCLLYTSPSPRDRQKSRMPSSA